MQHALLSILPDNVVKRFCKHAFRAAGYPAANAASTGRCRTSLDQNSAGGLLWPTQHRAEATESLRDVQGVVRIVGYPRLAGARKWVVPVCSMYAATTS